MSPAGWAGTNWTRRLALVFPHPPPRGDPRGGASVVGLEVRPALCFHNTASVILSVRSCVVCVCFWVHLSSLAPAWELDSHFFVRFGTMRCFSVVPLMQHPLDVFGGRGAFTTALESPTNPGMRWPGNPAGPPRPGPDITSDQILDTFRFPLKVLFTQKFSKWLTRSLYLTSCSPVPFR